MSMKKNEWLQQFGGCTTLENTPANFVELLTEYYRDPLVIFLWSEFDRVTAIFSLRSTVEIKLPGALTIVLA